MGVYSSAENLARHGVQHQIVKELLGRFNILTARVWFLQSLLLGSRKDMDDIANAIEKIYENRDQLT